MRAYLDDLQELFPSNVLPVSEPIVIPSQPISIDEEMKDPEQDKLWNEYKN